MLKSLAETAGAVRRRKKFIPKPATWAVYIGVILAIVLVKALLLHLFGRSLICPCGVKLWLQASTGEENSQHVADWYSISHLIAGMGFAAVMIWTSPKWPFGWKLVAAAAFSAGWEIAENTPWIVTAFANMAHGEHYTGDTILNSMFDTIFVLAGFGVALSLPRFTTIVLAVVLDVATYAAIGDSLAVGTLRFAGSLVSP